MSSPAQELFAALLKNEFAPALRAQGMRGSGRSFRLRSETHFALLGFQTSKWSNPSEAIFTVNLKVVEKSTWAVKREEIDWLPEEPNANTYDGDFEWMTRIGPLLSDDEDIWWEVRPGEDNDATIAEVVDALVEVAVPALKRQAGVQ